MTARILALITPRRQRPAMGAVMADRLSLMRYRIGVLGDKEREMNRWRDEYRLRTGRAA